MTLAVWPVICGIYGSSRNPLTEVERVAQAAPMRVWDGGAVDSAWARATTSPSWAESSARLGPAGTRAIR